jgi:hypothetical protein
MVTKCRQMQLRRAAVLRGSLVISLVGYAASERSLCAAAARR